MTNIILQCSQTIKQNTLYYLFNQLSDHSDSCEQDMKMAGCCILLKIIQAEAYPVFSKVVLISLGV